MSLLSEVAGRADVPVEGVVRVVTRQPVSRRIEQRVLTVLDALEPAQLRSLERLALAAAPNVLPVGAERPSAAPVGPGRPDNGPVNAPAERPASPEPRLSPDARSLERFDRNGAGSLSEADRVTAQLGALLEDIVHSLNDMRRDVLADRRDRVDDLAVLVDLLTTSWRGVDRRLGRIERSLARLDAAREPRPQIPLQPLPQPPEPEPVVAPAVEPPPPEVDQPSRARRVATMLGTPLLFLGALAAALLTFELMASSSDDPRLGPPSAPQPTTSLSSTTGGTPTVTESRQPTTPATTTPANTTPATTTPTTTATTPTTTGSGAAGFTPARVFAWPAAANAGYYHVRFFRGNNLIYQAWPSQSRLTLPKTVVFAPGSYRWNVRPGVGPRSQNRFGRPIINSTFEVES